MSPDNKEEQVEGTARVNSEENLTGAHGIDGTHGVDGVEGTPLSEKTRRELIAALKQNWQREMEGVRMYRDLAHKERDATKRGVLEKMAEAEARRNAWMNSRCPTEPTTPMPMNAARSEVGYAPSRWTNGTPSDRRSVPTRLG